MQKECKTPTQDALPKQYDKPKDSGEEATTKQANLTITDNQSATTVSVPEEMFLDNLDYLSTMR